MPTYKTGASRWQAARLEKARKAEARKASMVQRGGRR